MPRPRDPAIDIAVRRTVGELLAEVGFEGMTIEAVATQANVSRPSIYRRWSSKAEMVLDLIESSLSVGRGAGLDQDAVAPDTGTLRGDLIELVDRLVSTFDGLAAQGLAGGIAAEMAGNPEFAEALRQRLLSADEERLAVVFTRAAARGEVAADIDALAAIEALAGVVFYRLVMLHRPCPPAWRRAVVDLFAPPPTSSAT